MRDKWVRRALAFTIPLVFVTLFVGAFLTDRVMDPVVSGGLIAILGTVVALFSDASNNGRDRDRDRDRDLARDRDRDRDRQRDLEEYGDLDDESN